MNYLIISIFCSVAVGILLKTARARGVAAEHAVGINYPVAVALTLYFLRPDTSQLAQVLPHSGLFVLLGALLPAVFVVMARALGAAGIVKTDAAQRLSLFLPVLAAFGIFGETLAAHRIAGLAVAFAALVCLLIKSGGKNGGGAYAAWLLTGVWAGYGVIDILFKQLSKTGSATPLNLLVAFTLAALLMGAYLLWQRKKWTLADVLTGVLLGCLNFANILFYIKAHQALKDSPTLVFAGMNMGVIVLGTLAGTVLFKESLSKLNIFGVFLALWAIVLLYFGAGLLPWMQVF